MAAISIYLVKYYHQKSELAWLRPGRSPEVLLALSNCLRGFKKLRQIPGWSTAILCCCPINSHTNGHDIAYGHFSDGSGRTPVQKGLLRRPFGCQDSHLGGRLERRGRAGDAVVSGFLQRCPAGGAAARGRHPPGLGSPPPRVLLGNQRVTAALGSGCFGDGIREKQMQIALGVSPGFWFGSALLRKIKFRYRGNEEGECAAQPG